MEIRVTGISNEIIIGCYANERSIKQPIIIDLAAKLYRYDWVTQDKLSTTVNYDELIDYIQQLLIKTNYHLLESLLQHLVNQVMLKYPIIQSLTLTATKPAICGVRAHDIKVSYTKRQKYKVALALGSNADNLPQQQLVTAIEIIGEYVTDLEVGGFYETEPYGFAAQNNFYNTAIIGYTELKPEELLSKIKTIEKLMGKQEIIRNGPRVIDIDLIFFADLVYTHNFLTVPHKHMHLRDFVLKPLLDIAPEWIHPLLKEPISKIYHQLREQDTSIIKQCEYSK